MKKFVVILLLATSIMSFAQQQNIPSKEFSLSLSEDNVTLTRGENKKIEALILKSKAYQKGKMKMGLSSTLPHGLTLSFHPENGNADVTEVTITALSDASPGNYAIILNATINYKTKGTILKVTVE